MDINLTPNQFKEAIIYCKKLSAEDKKLLTVLAIAPDNCISKYSIQKYFDDKNWKQSYTRMHRLGQHLESYHKLGLEKLIQSKKFKWLNLVADTIQKDEKAIWKIKPNLLSILHEAEVEHMIFNKQLKKPKAKSQNLA